MGKWTNNLFKLDMKQTAVEWLVEQLKINNYISDNAHWLIDDAKEMEKQLQNELSIGFAEWYLNLYESDDSITFCNNTINELLEIYKQQIK